MAELPLSPGRDAQLEEAKLLGLCNEILKNTQSELSLNLRFLDVALSALSFVPDGSLSEKGNTLGFATDGNSFAYAPSALTGMYLHGRINVNRVFLHSLLHCIFCHFANRGTRDPFLWDLSCDIAAEYIADSLQKPGIRLPDRPMRKEVYQQLLKGGDTHRPLKVLNAEGIYRSLSEQAPGKSRLISLSQLFARDNHCLWDTEPDKPDIRMQLSVKNKWQDIRDKMQTALETGDRDPGKERDPLYEDLRAENRRRYDYRDFLRRFSILKEELHADEDSFDYIYYTYGLSHYGNMPLIEPLETKEVFAVEEFIIVIDTSFSTSGELVRKFLSETWSILSERNSFFRSIHIRIIQCDDRVESDVRITSQEEMEGYLESFRLIGQGGTDFRPAFSYVNGLIRQHEFKKLRGLIYFTDGKGIYPLKRPPYETAFIFLDDDYQDYDVPPWAMRLFIRSEDLEETSSKQQENLKS
ncbi:MAG: VWA-like domain-containing protein [Eubacteriales bacterium]|nr:VWA-like domain-containing protein [Eubacteriales bacterium]